MNLTFLKPAHIYILATYSYIIKSTIKYFIVDVCVLDMSHIVPSFDFPHYHVIMLTFL